MAAVRHGETSMRYARMDDFEVVRELWATIESLDDDQAADTLYWLTGELLERWAPEIEWAATEADYIRDENKEAELEAHAAFLARRRRVREIFAAANEGAAAVWAESDDERS